MLVPIKSGLERTKISFLNFEAQLAKNNAKLVHVFDINKTEGRTWDNMGLVEDIATGSAAGPMGAYLYKYNYCTKNEVISTKQGQYVGKHFLLKVSCTEETDEIFVSGEVVVLKKGELFV